MLTRRRPRRPPLRRVESVGTGVTSSLQSAQGIESVSMLLSPSGRDGKQDAHAADTHASTGKGTESRLGTRARGLRADTTGGADLDVEGSDANLLAALFRDDRQVEKRGEEAGEETRGAISTRFSPRRSQHACIKRMVRTTATSCAASICLCRSSHASIAYSENVGSKVE